MLSSTTTNQVLGRLMSVKGGQSNDYVLKHQEGRPNPYIGLEGTHGLV